MKSIQSEGGPLIGFDRNLMHHWSGISGKRFIGPNSRCESDYEALSEVYPRGKTAANIEKISGLSEEGLLITMPLDTAIIESDGISAYLAQVIAAEIGWSFSSLSRGLFDQVDYLQKENVVFSVNDCMFTFFDAAYSAELVGDDYINFDLRRGTYVLSNAMYKQENVAELILLKIEQVK